MKHIPVYLDQKRTAAATLLLLLAAGALLRFYGLSTESLWFDEAYSVWVARHSIDWHIALSMQRIFPPLYYLLLHFWLPFGDTEFIIRSLSVIIGLGSIVAIYALARQLFNTRVALLSALLLAISPLHIWYSQEGRMYILVATLGLCSAYFMLLALRDGRLWHWLAYVLSTAMAMNTHYFAIFLAPFENAYVLYLFVRQHARHGLWKRWLLSQTAVALLSAIGLAGVFSSESNYWWGLLNTWHGAPTFRDLVGLMFSFSLGTTAQGPLLHLTGLLLFGFCVAWNVLPQGARLGGPRFSFVVDTSVHYLGDESPTTNKGCDLRRLRSRLSQSVDDALVFTLLYLVVPLGIVFLLSQFRSFWVLRYIFPFLPPYCIILARGISRMRGQVLGTLTLAAIVLISLWPIANMYRYEQKENWRAAVQYITSEEQPNDLIFMVDEDVWLPFEHYYRGSVRRMGASRVVTDRDLLAARVGMVLPSYSRIWLVLSHTDNLLLKDYLSMSRYTELVSEKHFTGVEVDLFAIKPAVAGGG